MSFDLSTAKPVTTAQTPIAAAKGFDLSTAKPVQEIANRGLQDNFDPTTRAKFDEAINRGLITVKDDQGFISAASETARTIGQGALVEAGSGLAGLLELAKTQDPIAAENAIKQFQSGFAAPDPSERSQSQLKDIGGVVESVMSAANIPLSGLAGLTELATGQGVSQAVETIEDVQTRGLGKAAGERVFEETGSPLAATVAEVAPQAIFDIATGGAARGPLVAGEEALKQGARQAARQAPEVTRQAVEVAPQVARDVIQAGEDVTRAVFDFQTPAKQRVAELIKEGAGDIDTAKFLLTETGKVKADKLANETIKQGFDKAVIATVKTASKADKIKMVKMTNIMERGKRNARFAAENRPSDVVGDTLLDKVKVIRGANLAAGRNIDRAAKDLKGKEIDISAAVDDFAQSLDNLGVKLVDDGKGGFKPDFELSQLAAGDRGPLKEVIRQMNIRGAGGVDGFAAHRMKRLIDNNVTFGKVKTGLSGDAERALKSFRANLDASLDNTFPAYDKVNIAYADTIGALNSIQGALGTKLDLGGAQADKALGTKLRGLLSNNATRVNLLDATKEIESVARKHGAKGKLLIEGKGLGRDDLLNQILFVDELDSRFGPVARTSFQGQIKQAFTDAGSIASEAKISPITATVKGVATIAEKLRGINDENAFSSIRDLLSQ